ncbi:hypothetical protein [Ruminococcus albus]|uniref:C-type lectin domain-containing protein n=1 Tax=Ruminococcus albus TaxID=1264 RepID=A0A1I1JT94_RUMAL|nr:hypothetical protein SAMN02910406_01863 [Ruminococcus albus]
MQIKKLLAVVMSLCMVAGDVSCGAPVITQSITAQAANTNISTYPKNIKVEYSEKYRQVRFTWDKVEGADKYAIAVYLAGKWKVQAQNITDTVYTSPKNLTPGMTYKVAIAAKVNGTWDTKNAIKNAVTCTIGNDSTSMNELILTDIDTDKDGICDMLELQMQLNPHSKDSDGNGILDGDEDFDGDGITNLKEIKYGICPYAKDSDYDDINDYDELFVYDTDPYNEDTDGDFIPDGDELIINTDPKAVTTNGIKDNENTKEYKFSNNCDQTKDFNTDDQPFKFSFDITAAGLVDKTIKVSETGYRNAIDENPYIVGKSPYISYDKNMKTDNVSVYFAMQDGFEGNIEDYTVFFYWEGYNLLIPIETYYDKSTKTVYAHNNSAGTYCLMNSKKLTGSLNKSGNNSSNTAISAANTTSPSNDDGLNVGNPTSWNGNEYFLITSDNAMTYDEWVGICARYGGYPATIADADENEVVSDVSSFNEIWLGASIEKPSIISYKINWITGEETGYTSWGSGSYIFGMSETDHIEAFWGLWFIKSQDTKLNAVVCERPQGGTDKEDDEEYSGLSYTPLEDLKLNNKSDKDTDGDGIPDYLELSEYDLGTFDNTTGDYKPADYGHYFDLALNIGISVSSSVGDKMKDIHTSSFRSHPFKKNSDKDDYPDSKDGTPEEENEDLIEILSLKGDNLCTYESHYLEDYYESKGKNCRIHYFNGYDSFIRRWNHIGNRDWDDPKPTDSDSINDYYYHVTDVILVSHGYCLEYQGNVYTGFGFILGNDEILTHRNTSEGMNENWHRIEDIDANCRQFDNLEMMICFSDCVAEPDNYTKSTAQAFFDRFPSINRVFAFDCSCTIVSRFDKPVWVGAVEYETGRNYISPSEPSEDEQDIEEFKENVSCKGQVLYERGKDKNSDLYDGLEDVQLEIYYTKIVETSGGRIGAVRFVDDMKPFLEPNEYGFDPVFYDEYLAN